MAEEALFDDDPRALRPVYTMRAPSRPVSLFRGDLRLSVGGAVYEAPGKIQLEWFPELGTVFHMPVESFKMPELGPAELDIPKHSRKLYAYVRRVSGYGEHRWRISGHIDDRASENTVKVNSVLVGVANFCSYRGDFIQSKDFHYTGRMVIDERDWLVTLDALPNRSELASAAEAFGGYAIGHVCKVARRDGAAFAIEQPLAPLFSFLSFASGGWSGLCLPVGYDEAGQRNAEVWSANKTSPAVAHNNWFSGTLDPKEYTSTFHRFLQLWDTKEGSRALRYGIGWYINGMGTGEVEASLIQTLAGMEILAFYCLCHWTNSTSCTEKKFDNMTSDARVRLMLEKCGIPASIPPSYEAFRELVFAHPDWPHHDGPIGIVRIRNSIIHPVIRLDPNSRALVQALRLALGYMELVILRLLDYRGTYQDRLRPNAVLTVPWV